MIHALAHNLFNWVRQLALGGACQTMISPLDIQIDCDDRTLVQPDDIVICDRNKIISRCVYGAQIGFFFVYSLIFAPVLPSAPLVHKQKGCPTG